MKNEFYHYSQKPIINLNQQEIVFGDTYDEKRKHGKYHLCPFMKPDGFWFSPENDKQEYDGSWRDYLQQECHGGELLNYKYHVELASCANLLILDTVAKMYEFNKRYLLYYEEPVLRSLAILWQKVALDYQGIIIAPYHDSLRLHPNFRWYYLWDCASGCVWDISAVQSIKLQQGG